ncbi:hypothetical protein ACJJTC_009760 [Scirpophaga incertulas]
MSLDKQRILSELGSVINQLQSADCGCMGKLFTNPNQGGQVGTTGAAMPTYGGCNNGCFHGHRCKHHSNFAGYGCNQGFTEAGESTYYMNRPNYINPHCNPPKLYADTYNYLNNNLVKPVAQEVYNELKSITPENTITNNALGAKMGLTNGDTSNSGSMNMRTPIRHDNLVPSMNNMPIQNSQPNGIIGGMGPQIVNMMMGDSKKSPVQGGKVPGSVVNTHLQENSNNPSNITPNSYVLQGNNGQPATNVSPVSFVQDPSSQYFPSGDKFSVNKNNLATPQKTFLTHNPYGQHSQAVMKFNEMFPSIGDLGYDPMAIAIQMNPENKQKAVMDTMQKFLYNTPSKGRTDSSLHANINKPVLEESKAASVKAMQPDTAQYQQVNAVSPGKEMHQSTIQNTKQEQGYLSEHNLRHNPPDPSTLIPQQQQQVCLNPEITYNQQQNQLVNKTPNYVNQDPYSRDNNNTNGLITQYQQQIESPSNDNKTRPAKDVNKELILPSDNLGKQVSPKHYECNTLGQTIEKFPGYIYRTAQENLPQTLSPQPTPNVRNISRYSNVKFTESKTSLMGNNATRKTLSKKQLQHIYNQYKGSQSYTQQSLSPSAYGATVSDGKLNVDDANRNVISQKGRVEKFGGDVIANVEQGDYNNDQSGEVVAKTFNQDALYADTPQGDSELVKPTSGIPTRQAKTRNGLQDVVYPSYSSSVAWSFHGTSNYLPVHRAGERQLRY